MDIRDGPARHRKKSPENTRAGALAFEATLRTKLARGEPIVLPGTISATRDQKFEQFAWRWFEDYVVPNNKFSEQRAKKGILTRSLIPYFGKCRIREISTHDVEQYKAQQTRDGASKKTIRNRLTVLKKCLDCAHEWLNLDKSPPRFKWPKCPPARTDYLSSEECELLLSHAEGLIYEMALTALRTGMRQGELKGLQWSSIDWQTRSIAVRHSYCDVRKTLDTPKSNRERHIPLDVDVFELLHARNRATGYVFMDGDKPFNSPRLNLRLARLCQKAGLRKITWHVLRHTFASQLAMRGTPLHVVQTLLGHASITTTLRYAHVAPSALRTAIDMLNPKQALEADFGQPADNAWAQVQQRRAISRAA